MDSSQCSDIFADVFDSHGGGCIRTCACGITYFDDSIDGGWTWEAGELETLRAKANTNPKKYIAVDHTVGCMRIGGEDIVYGCSCDRARRYENFITAHARQLAEYLNRKSAEAREAADAMAIPVLPLSPKPRSFLTRLFSRKKA